MKKLLLALLLPTCWAQAQTLPIPPTPTEGGPPAGQEAAAPFHLASAIVVHTADSTRTAYQNLTTLLLEQGYQLQETAPAQGRIITD